MRLRYARNGSTSLREPDGSFRFSPSGQDVGAAESLERCYCTEVSVGGCVLASGPTPSCRASLLGDGPGGQFDERGNSRPLRAAPWPRPRPVGGRGGRLPACARWGPSAKEDLDRDQEAQGLHACRGLGLSPGRQCATGRCARCSACLGRPCQHLADVEVRCWREASRVTSLACVLHPLLCISLHLGFSAPLHSCVL